MRLFWSSLFFISLLATDSFADNGKEIVYLDCQAGNFFHIKILTLYDITPVLDKRTFDLDEIKETQKKQICRLSNSIKVIVEINGNRENPKNNNISVFLNSKPINNLTFDDPNRIYEYFVLNTINGIQVNFEEERAKKIKSTSVNFGKDIN